MEKSQKWWILGAMSAALSVSYLDITAVAVSLPQVQHLLHGSENQIHWVINAYLLTTTIFIIAGGRLGDLYGHKLCFLSGAILFLFSSIACAIATSLPGLIGGRLFQGIAAALLIANTSTIMLTLFPPEERGKSNGIYIGIASLFLALGPFIGGLLTEFLSWRWVFWFNVPLLLFSITVAWLFLDTGISRAKSKQTHKEKTSFDWLGLLLLGSMLTCLCVSLMEGDLLGYRSHFILLLLFASLLFLVFFILVEQRAKAPLVNFHLFKNKIYLGSAISTFFLQGVLMITIFMPLWYQIVLGKSPLIGGLLGLPTSVPILFLAPLVGKIIDRYGFKIPTLAGLLIYLFSLLYTAFFLNYQNYWLILLGVIGVGVAIPFANLPIILVGLSSVPPKQHGMGVGVLYTVRQGGASLGMAIMSGLFSLIYTHHLNSLMSSFFPQLNLKSIVNMKHLLSESSIPSDIMTQYSPAQITTISHLAKQAYTMGVSVVLYTTLFMLAMSILVVLLMENATVVEVHNKSNNAPAKDKYEEEEPTILQPIAE